MPRFAIKTLGCKANLSDSLGLSRELRARGWTESPQTSGGDLDLCIVNSCTVTDEADRQSRQMASRLARLNPRARVVVTGCAAEVDPERLASSKGIDYVVGTRDRARLVELVLERYERPRPERGEVLGVATGYEEIASKHPIDREWPALEAATDSEPSPSLGTLPQLPRSEESHTRAFLKIQEGCNAFCTYCIIPYGRGPSRSLEPAEVVARVRELCAQGARELVLTGTNIGDYGMDLCDGHSLELLIRMILDETPLERLRLSSLDPVEITPGILALIEAEPRLCPHLHVSLQSPLDRILKLMKRKYSAQQARECLQAIARLKPVGGPVFVGMDLITGFPGETDEEFERGLEELQALPWTRLHVFPYSEREGTPATRLKGSVPKATRSARARRLMELSLSRLQAHYEKVLRAATLLEGVLLERPQSGPAGEWLPGYTPGYLRLRVPAGKGARRGLTVRVQPSTITVDRASGEAYFSGQIV